MRIKKLWLVILTLVMLASCTVLAACGGGKQPSGGNEPTKQFELQVEINNNVLTWTASENISSTEIVIDGKTYSVTNNYDLARLGLRAGEYTVIFKYNHNNQENSYDFSAFIGISEDEAIQTQYYWITFEDDQVLIKRIAINVAELPYTLVAADFPSTENYHGYDCEWDYLVGAEIDNNCTISLSKTPIVYNITYVLNGGTLPEEYITTYTVEEYGSLPVPTRSGYLFAGWFKTADFSGERVNNLGGYGHITLYANFEKITPTSQVLIDAMNRTVALKEYKITVGENSFSYKADGNSLYYYEPNVVLLLNGTVYDYSSKKCFPIYGYYEDYYQTTMLLEVLNVADYSQISYLGESKGVKKFNAVNYGVSTDLEVKDGLVTKLTVYADIETICEISTKADVVSAPKGFTQTEYFKVTVVCNCEYHNEEGGSPEEWIERGTVINYNESPAFNHWFSSGDIRVKNYYTDAELKNVYANTGLTGNVTLYPEYITLEEMLESITLTLKMHCDCQYCNGYREYKVKYRNYSEVVEAHLLEYMRNIIAGNGYVISGCFSDSAKTQSINERNVEKAIYYYLENGYDTEVELEVWTKKESAQTASVTVHCGCKNHSAPIPFYFTDYASSEIIAYEHALEGKYLEGVYADKELTQQIVDLYFQDGVVNDGVTDVYFNWVNDTRVKVTFDVSGFIGRKEWREIFFDDTRKGLRFDSTPEYLAWPNEPWDFYPVLMIGEDSVVTEWYLDKACTRPASFEEGFSTNTVLYGKSEKLVEFTFDFQQQVSNVKVKLLPGLSFVESMKLSSEFDLTYSLGERISYLAERGEFVETERFYADENFTTAVEVVPETSRTFYVRILNKPHLTLVCNCGLSANYHEFILHNFKFENFDNSEHGKFLELDDNGSIYIYPTWYYDSAFTKPVEESLLYGEQMIYEDLTLYAKFDISKYERVLHCGCDLHPEGYAFTVQNWIDSFICENFAQVHEYGIDNMQALSISTIYVDEDRTVNTTVVDTSKYNEFWIKKLNKLDIVFSPNDTKTYGWFSNGLREDEYYFESMLYDGLSAFVRENESRQGGLYYDSAFKNPYYTYDSIVNSTEKKSLYFKEETDNKVKIYNQYLRGYDYSQVGYTEVNLFDTVGRWKLSFIEQENPDTHVVYKFIGFYRDSEYTQLIDANKVFIGATGDIYVKYGEYQLPKMTVVCDAGEHYNHRDSRDFEITIGATFKELLKNDMAYKVDYTSYLSFDSEGEQRVDMNATAKEGTYYWHFVKDTRPLVTVNCNCGCDNSDYLNGGNGMFHTDFPGNPSGTYYRFRIDKGTDISEILEILKMSYYTIGGRFDNICIYTDPEHTVLLKDNIVTGNLELYVAPENDTRVNVTFKVTLPDGSQYSIPLKVFLNSDSNASYDNEEYIPNDVRMYVEEWLREIIISNTVEGEEPNWEFFHYLAFASDKDITQKLKWDDVHDGMVIYVKAYAEPESLTIICNYPQDDHRYHCEEMIYQVHPFDTFADINIYVEYKDGCVMYISYDVEGLRRVAPDDAIANVGTLYVQFEQDTRPEVKVIFPFDDYGTLGREHEVDSFNNGNALGTIHSFRIDKGTNLAFLTGRVSSIYCQGASLQFSRFEFFSDSEYKNPIDLNGYIVSEDTVIYARPNDTYTLKTLTVQIIGVEGMDSQTLTYQVYTSVDYSGMTRAHLSLEWLRKQIMPDEEKGYLWFFSDENMQDELWDYSLQFSGELKIYVMPEIFKQLTVICTEQGEHEGHKNEHTLYFPSGRTYENVLYSLEYKPDYYIYFYFDEACTRQVNLFEVAQENVTLYIRFIN